MDASRLLVRLEPSLGEKVRIITALTVGVALVAASPSTQAASPQDYAVGQIWEYKTRDGDEGSLLKIQQVEDSPALKKMGPIYHISVVGFRLANAQVTPVLPHAPVSRETLDASVVRLSRAQVAFPDHAEGVRAWREAEGGVYTIPVSLIVDLLDKQTANLR